MLLLLLMRMGPPNGAAVVEAERLDSRRSVQQGVYTDAQAERGEKAYEFECGRCHGSTLAGGDGPPLAGASFVSGWQDAPLSDLFAIVSDAMPQDAPGSLSPEVNADVLSFMLKANGFPAGTEDLPSDLKELADIVVTAK